MSIDWCCVVGKRPEFDLLRSVLMFRYHKTSLKSLFFSGHKILIFNQVKIELLDNKHVQDVVQQLQRLLSHLTIFYDQCHKLLDGQRFFPIEVDLAKGAFTYESVCGLQQVVNQFVGKFSSRFLYLNASYFL